MYVIVPLISYVRLALDVSAITRSEADDSVRGASRGEPRSPSAAPFGRAYLCPHVYRYLSVDQQACAEAPCVCMYVFMRVCVCLSVRMYVAIVITCCSLLYGAYRVECMLCIRPATPSDHRRPDIVEKLPVSPFALSSRGVDEFQATE